MTDFAPKFWTPRHRVTHREDGTIIMAHCDPLPDHMPLLADYLDHWADHTPDQTWLARRNENGAWRKMSYAAARDTARRIGASLLKIGVGPERPLLILSENSLEHALLSAACFYVGLPYAPVSPAYSLVSQDHKKLKDIVALLTPAAVFADDGAAFAGAFKSIQRDGMQTITLKGDADVTFADLLNGDATEALVARKAVTPETTVKYLFTSGSTGSPKAVINTNQMICAMQAMVRDVYAYLTEAPPVVLDWAPWNHTAAGNKTMYLVMTNGGSYYIDDGKPTPEKFGETLRNLREISCSWYFNVPVGWDLLVEALEQDTELAKRFFHRLGMMFYAGAGMAQHTWDRLRAVGHKTTGCEVLLATGLGSTETAPFALAWTTPEASSGNVGVPAKGLSMKLVPIGDKLELRLKGPSITPGYFGNPAKTKTAFDAEGYYCMGDALRPADPTDFSKGFFFDGRVAENFKLGTGTWVVVGAVRTALVNQLGGLIRDAVIVGENESELGALLLLSNSAKAMAPDLLRNRLKDKLKEAAATSSGSAGRVKRALILSVTPSFDKGEITEKGSLNQRVMRTNFSKSIARCYSDHPDLIRL